MSAVCSARRAVLASSRSGTSSSSSSRLAIASAPASPRRLSGRAKSPAPWSFQRASAWRMTVRRFMRVSGGAFDQDTAVRFARGVGAHRLVGGRGERVPGAQVEARAVAGTNELARLHLGTGEGFAVVCATVFYCVQLAAAAYDNHRRAVDLGRERYALAELAGRADVDPAAQNIPVCRRAASDIMDWLHGGSKVRLTRASRTVGIRVSLSRTSSTRMSPMPQPGAVRVICASTVYVPSSFPCTSHSYTSPRSTM